MIRRPPRSTLFPYTTLFRSVRHGALQAIAGRISGDVLVANPTSFDCNDLALWRGDLREGRGLQRADGDRKSTRLNSSHANISYAVFCLKKKANIPYSFFC